MTINAGKPDSPTRTVSRYRCALLIATGLFVVYQHHAAVTQIAEARAARRIDQAYVRGLEDANRHSATIIADLTKENTELHIRISHMNRSSGDRAREAEEVWEHGIRYLPPAKTQSDRGKGAPDDSGPH